MNNYNVEIEKLENIFQKILKKIQKSKSKINLIIMKILWKSK